MDKPINVTTWMNRIDAALKREKKYREDGQRIVDLYEGKKPDDTPFAILYSNTEVLAPALYNARPVPIVTRRFKDADPVGKAAAEVSTRVLKFLIDTEDADYDSFDDLMQPAVLDGIVTNRGLTRFRYVPMNNKECVYGESVRWDKFFHGYARSWKKVPWIGFEWDMTKEEIEQNFPNKPLDFKNFEQIDMTKELGEEQSTDVVLYKVYEIWDKASRKVYFFSQCCDEPLRVVDDPLGLTSFYPVPRPLNFTRKITTLTPTPLYTYYKSQAQELNELTRRLKAIIKAIRYRGAYNSTVEGIEKMLQAEDNELVPVENMASMPENSSMDQLLYIVPVNELAQTAQSLYVQREQVKSVIYEITGISDILRGASVASETATAQNIKNQWGTLRLKKMQKEVQRYCRDSLAIMLEIAANKFEPQTFMAMTGLPYLSAEQKQAKEMEMQMQAQQAQMAQQPPPEPDPQTQLQLASPTWEEIVGLLQNDVSRHYRTDIETNSTIDAEAAQDKQDISELLNGLSQFFNGIGPLVQGGQLPMSIAKEMLLVITRRYNFGSQLEEALQAMQEPAAPEEKPDPAAEAKAAAEKAKAEYSAQEAQAKMALLQVETQAEMALMQERQKIAQVELQIKEAELALKKQELELKAQVSILQHNLKLESLKAQAAAKRESANAAV